MSNAFSGPMALMLLCGLALTAALCPRREIGRPRPVRVAVGIALAAAVLLLDHTLVDFSTASTALEAPMCLIAMFLCGVLAWRIAWDSALYVTVWGFFITELSAQLVLISLSQLDLGDFAVPVRLVCYLAVTVAVSAGTGRFIAPRLLTGGAYYIHPRKLVFSLLILTMYLFLSNYQFLFWLLGEKPEGMSPILTAFRLVLVVACIGVMALQSSMEKKLLAEQELAVEQQLWKRREEQFRMSQENIDLINRKCHDLKYQMAAIRLLKDEEEIDKQMREMEQAVLLYDSAVRTGNRALDVILTEKCLYCEAHHISITCMVNGEQLAFIDQVDLYTMFSNALDNAIESVSRLEDAEKRMIQIAARTEGNLLLIRVRNCFDGPLELVNGLPAATSKEGEKGYHGYGTKSIRYTAEKYGGSASAQTADCYYTLNILIPLPCQ